MKTTHKYCTYLTIYSGILLPPFYIGSSSIEKVQNGYNGSVSSKKYKEIYTKEQKENKHLFKTIIVKTSLTRTMSYAMELYLQKKDDVVKSDLFYNMALAIKNGYFGASMEGTSNPNYGKKMSQEQKDKISKKLKGFPLSENTKSIMSKIRLNVPKSEEHKRNIGKAQEGNKNHMWGKIQSEESNIKRSKTIQGNINGPQEKVICPHCKKEGGISIMNRWHFDNCKFTG